MSESPAQPNWAVMKYIGDPLSKEASIVSIRDIDEFQVACPKDVDDYNPKKVYTYNYHNENEDTYVKYGIKVGKLLGKQTIQAIPKKNVPS